MEELIAVILAAGEGTRMRSSLPKVLHRLCGKPMLWHVLKSAAAVTARQIIITGYGADQVREYFGEEFFYLEQRERLGTGHALQQSLPHLPETGLVLVLCGDAPLLEKEVLQELIFYHRQSGASATVLTSRLQDPSGYGRIIRDKSGGVQKIVEELHLAPEEKALKEINTGTYCFDLGALKKYLPLLPKNEVKGEYYLTDLVHLLVEAGLSVKAHLLKDARLALGVNDRSQLSQAAALMRKKINDGLMRAGVTMIDPLSTYIDAGVEIGVDTVIYPQTVLEGETKVGKGCRLGPGAHLIDTRVGDGVLCRHSLVLGSVLEDGANVGPYAHIRPGSKIGPSVKIGDFVEIKNSSIGQGSKVSHLSYVGDAEIGPDVNMGAGSIVVNYDGRKKHKTVIGKGAFIGCNSNLVAPINIGKGAFVAAGSTVTRDVPSDSLLISRPEQIVKKGLGKRFLKKKKEK
ncbi:MAG TPA: bifunctional UDP-N-acetylglucosamine diphosphorylase/glucosamine-1-phosphate N-acetyltransferase GlmU [Firmicutes bacterium]|jgi:bifunctional UDP-N-acetylglucosamine pyrophosphorylase/glucosamine-1-phosphate N-acetyltransferase|nr:bifunctional UDP-N-acetylglucosamine diphosphorylase/glucosamine-1-phosphate N-acetyltransferase GlmU [Bacillota bacterium]